MVRERPLRAANGFVALIVLLAVALLAGFMLFGSIQAGEPVRGIVWILVLSAAFLCLPGLFVVNPNDARVLTLFGKYIGTVKEAGFWFANPFAVSIIPARGSRACASNPADTSTSSGANWSTTGSTRRSNAAAYTASPAPAESGMLRLNPLPSPSPVSVADPVPG